MRLLCLLFLVVFAGVVALLAYENQQEVRLLLFDRGLTTTLPILVGATYLAGMLSGWTVLGILRRSVKRVLREPLPGEYARSRGTA